MVTWHSSAAARRARTAAAPPTCIGVRHDTPSAALTSAPCWISRRISSTSPRRAATCRTVSPAAIFRCGFSFNRVCSGLCSPSSLPVAATISESNARDLAGSPLAIADASLLTRCCTFGSWWPCLSLLCLSLLCFLLLGMEEPNTRLDQLGAAVRHGGRGFCAFQSAAICCVRHSLSLPKSSTPRPAHGPDELLKSASPRRRGAFPFKWKRRQFPARAAFVMTASTWRQQARASLSIKQARPVVCYVRRSYGASASTSVPHAALLLARPVVCGMLPRRPSRAPLVRTAARREATGKIRTHNVVFKEALTCSRADPTQT